MIHNVHLVIVTNQNDLALLSSRRFVNPLLCFQTNTVTRAIRRMYQVHVDLFAQPHFRKVVPQVDQVVSLQLQHRSQVRPAIIEMGCIMVARDEMCRHSIILRIHFRYVIQLIREPVLEYFIHSPRSVLVKSIANITYMIKVGYPFSHRIFVEMMQVLQLLVLAPQMSVAH